MAENPLWAVLPVKPFAAAKSRLRGVLSPAERSSLARRLLSHALGVVRACPGIDEVLVVSADPEALFFARRRGARTLTEQHVGLNQALLQARRFAAEQGAGGLLVVAPDLPLVTPADLQAVLQAASPVVVAPDRRLEGTNALLLRPVDVIPFAFGRRSFARHLGLAAAAGIDAARVSLPGLAFDVDLPGDWRDLLAVGWVPDGLNGDGPDVSGPAGPGRPAPATRARRPSA